MSSDRSSWIPISLKAGVIGGLLGLPFGIFAAIFSIPEFLSDKIHLFELFLIPVQYVSVGFTVAAVGGLAVPLHHLGVLGDISAGIICGNCYLLIALLLFVPEAFQNPDLRSVVTLGIMMSAVGGLMGWNLGREIRAESPPTPSSIPELVSSPHMLSPKPTPHWSRFWPVGFDLDLFLLNALIALIPVLIAATHSTKGRTFTVGSLEEFWISFQTLAITSTVAWLGVNVLALWSWRWHDMRSLGWRFAIRYAFVNLGISWLIQLSVCLFTVLVFGLEQWFRAAS